MKPYTTSVTINEVTFTGTLTPAEPMVMYYPDGSGHPGTSAEFDIDKIEGDPIKLVDLIEGIHLNIWEELTDKCLEKIESDNE